MIKTSIAKIKGICPTVLLSLSLLLGFISAPPLNYNQERQSAQTELISRTSATPKRIAVYRFLKRHFPFLFSLSCQEIVRRLMSYERIVMIEHSENLKPEELAKRLKMQLLTLTLTNSRSSDSYVLRG